MISVGRHHQRAQVIIAMPGDQNLRLRFAQRLRHVGLELVIAEHAMRDRRVRQIDQGVAGQPGGQEQPISQLRSGGLIDRAVDELGGHADFREYAGNRFRKPGSDAAGLCAQQRDFCNALLGDWCFLAKSRSP
jgi:hypothetical protein